VFHRIDDEILARAVARIGWVGRPPRAPRFWGPGTSKSLYTQKDFFHCSSSEDGKIACDFFEFHFLRQVMKSPVAHLVVFIFLPFSLLIILNNLALLKATCTTRHRNRKEQQSCQECKQIIRPWHNLGV
jgi:hypothetical protein